MACKGKGGGEEEREGKECKRRDDNVRERTRRIREKGRVQ